VDGVYNVRELSETDEDERYARLLQQQEIALARSFVPGGLIFDQEGMLGIAESDGSIDMSYEGLLELQENIGEVKKRGLDNSAIMRLERFQYNQKEEIGKSRGGEDNSCAVCMNEFVLDEKLINLPCLHHFHEHCAEGWLRVRANCPVCRESVEMN
jgi:hypothetical protein